MVLRRDFPELTDRLLKLPLSPNDEELAWRHFKWGNNYYIGQVDKKNNITGRGAYVVPNVNTVICSWVNGQKFGFGEIYDGTGRLEYQGNFADNDKNGFGKLFKSNGHKYEGMFKDSLFSGKGKYIWSDGTSWEGYFDKGNLHGSGTYTDQFGNNRPVEYCLNEIVEKHK